jgi:YD repeat-containing protein
MRRQISVGLLSVSLCVLSTEAFADTANYTYDALGRLKVEQFSSGTSNGIVRTYAYDAAGNRTQSGSILITAPKTVSNATSAGAEITLKVTGSATGKYTFSENGAYLGEAYVTGGVASVFLQGFPLGTHTILASYSEDNGATTLYSFIFTLKVQNLSWLPAVLELLLSN